MNNSHKNTTSLDLSDYWCVTVLLKQTIFETGKKNFS